VSPGFLLFSLGGHVLIVAGWVFVAALILL
jgi:hypothetical protein